MSSTEIDSDDTTIYKVVINQQDQYSIWPAHRDNPRGWQDAGKVGRKAACLSYIKEVWTDMRPSNLRKRMEELARIGTAHIKFTDAKSTELQVR